MTVLKGIRKRLLITAKRKKNSTLTKCRKIKKIGFLSKKCRKIVYCGQQKFSFKAVILSLWSFVEALGRPE